MAYNRSYPYVDPYRYNADWLLFEMKALQEKWEKFLEDFYKDLENWKDGVEADINNFKTTMEAAFNAFKENVTTIITDFEQEITEKQTAFETKITNQQTAFENNIQTQQEEFETLINNSITSIRNEWSAFQTNINNIVNSVKNLPNEWDEYKTRVDKEIADMTEYINNYFNNLDVSAELDRIIDNKVEDGTLTPVIQDALDNEINHKQNRVIFIVGDDPGMTTSRDLAFYIQQDMRTVYPKTLCYQDLTGFYNNNNAWESVKKLKAEGKTATDILCLLQNIPASSTETNITNLMNAIQKEFPNANVKIVTTKPEIEENLRYRFYAFLNRIRVSSIIPVYNIAPGLCVRNYYSFGVTEAWLNAIKKQIICILENSSINPWYLVASYVMSNAGTAIENNFFTIRYIDNFVHYFTNNTINLKSIIGTATISDGYTLFTLNKAQALLMYYKHKFIIKFILKYKGSTFLTYMEANIEPYYDVSEESISFVLKNMPSSINLDSYEYAAAKIDTIKELNPIIP